jgi:uncharacterized protein with HEPN domain
MDILEAMERIQHYAARGEEAFRSDELIQNWMTSHLQVIGEAARSLSQEIRDSAPEIPWTQIIGMRHILEHQYFEIDLDQVWRVVHYDLPTLKGMVVRLLGNKETRP